MIKNFIFLFSVLCVVTLLPGCAATTDGAEYISDSSRIEKLLNRNAEKKDVFYAVGQPMYVRQENKKTVWIYMRTDSRLSAKSYMPIVNIFATGANYKVNIKEFEFDESNRLKSIKNDDFEVTTNAADFHGWYNDKVKSQIDADIENNRDEMKKFSLPFDEKTIRNVISIEKNIRHQQAVDASRGKK